MKRVWHDGKLVKGRISLSPFDRGLTLGDGLFETIAVMDSVALWRFEHVERMRAAAGLIGIAFPEELLDIAIDAVTFGLKGSHVLRLTLTRGEAARGLSENGSRPTLVATIVPFDAALRFKPLTLATALTRRNSYSVSSSIKSLSYIVSAAREARILGAEDALMLNTAGRVACSSIGNVFVETEDALLTPVLSEAVLPGIMRAEVIKLARLAGIKVREGKIPVAILRDAKAIYVSNSIRFLRPVARLDEKLYRRTKLFALLSRGLLNAETEQLLLG
jgi:branched-chain amino acid aminotransferase